MEIREYKSSDCNEIADLFYNTVHFINAKDYTEDQLNVWATENIHIDEWNEPFLDNYTVVAEENGIIIGFDDINNEGTSRVTSTTLWYTTPSYDSMPEIILNQGEVSLMQEDMYEKN